MVRKRTGGSGSTPNTALRRARELRCRSQQELAEYLGTTPFTICRWERGITIPGPHFRHKLCDLFERSADELGFIRSEASAPVPSSLPSLPTPTVQPPALNVEPGPSPLAFSVPPLFPSNGLVGRDRLFATLLHQVLTQSRIALQGLPGVGKTALAIAAARDGQVAEAFDGGTLWIPLGASPDVEALLVGLALTLGIAPQKLSRLTGVASLARAVGEAIGTRRTLLIMDDVWSLEDAVTFCVGGPRCTYLITTRLPQLATYFTSEDVSRVNELDEDDAVALLGRLAPQLVADEPETARAVVQSAGGLPLAVILIGRYVRAQAHSGQPRRTREALHRLRAADERLRLADPCSFVLSHVDGAVGTPTSLGAIIQVSDQSVSEAARAALRALSVFPSKPNCFSEEAALAVSGARVDTIDALTDAGLLESCGPARYTLHRTIADYAHVRLTDESTFDRMVAYYTEIVCARDVSYAVLGQEMENILAALDIASAQGLSAQRTRMTIAFTPFLLAKGFYSLAESHLHQAERDMARERDEIGVARILLYKGRIMELRGHLREALRLYDDALRAARTSGAHELLIELLAHKAEVGINRGDYMRAEPALRRGLRLARMMRDGHSQANLLRLLGEVRDCNGAFAEGDELYLEGLALARDAHDAETISSLLQNLGEKATKRGQYAQAQEYLAQGLVAAQVLQHPQRMSALLTGLSVVALSQRNIAEAADLCQQSVQLARTISHPIRLINALRTRGVILACQHDYSGAVQQIGEALSLAREIEHPFLIAECLVCLGEVELEQGHLEAARATLEEALRVSRTASAREMEANALYALARMRACQNDMVEANALARQSLLHFEAQGHVKAKEIARWLAEAVATPARH